MTDHISLTALRQVLSLVFPMEGVIVVGAGRGQGLEGFHSASTLLLIDARAECVEALKRQYFESPRLTAVQAVIAGYSGSAEFHFASKPDESGLIEPESLQLVWRNLTSHATERVETATLPELLSRLELPADFRCNWLVVDCLPALPVLKAATQILDNIEVLELRCVRDEAISGIDGANVTSARQWLQPLGFRLTLEIEEIHPKLIKAVFSRDLRSLAKDNTARTAERDGLAKEVQMVRAERDTLAQAKAAAEKLATERKTQLEALTAERQQLTAACEALTKDKAALKAERDGLKPQKQRFGSNADIDDFINDIAPFFANRSIVYVDVGAYVGEVFLRLLATKKINVREAHLIEPNPQSYQKLKEAIRGSDVQSCNAYHIGISNTPGIAKFKAAKTMTKKVLAELSCEDATNLFEVECRRLDDVSNFFTDGRVHLMKLDVEGEELDVISSAERLFREQKVDVLYVEVGLNQEGSQQTYFCHLDALLQGYGYRAFKIYEQKNEWIDDSPWLRRCNIAYMSNKFQSAHSYTKILAGELSQGHRTRTS